MLANNEEIKNETSKGILGEQFPKEVKSKDLKPHEILTLNFLVNEYLVMRNYKMTANTFADENAEQVCCTQFDF